jgi:hypothetical protein
MRDFFHRQAHGSLRRKKMRFLVWICRVILLATVAAFVATLFYMTHNMGTQMDSAKPALNLVTVIGASVLGLGWPLMRRYWQALILLISLGVLRGLFGFQDFESLRIPLLTPFQADYLWVPIGVVAAALVVTLIARAVTSDRKLRALKHVQSLGIPGPKPAVAVAPPASLVTPGSEPATPAEDAAAAPEGTQ